MSRVSSQEVIACFVSISCQLLAIQVLLRGSKQMEVTGPLTANQICDCVQCYSWEVMDHPPCSRDLGRRVIPLFVPLNLLPRSLDIFKF